MPRWLGRRARVVAWRALWSLMLLGAWGCDDQSLKENERQEIWRILRTGVSFSDDAFVRAETLRVVEALGDPALVELAQSAAEDEEPMVGVVALRTLLRLHHPDAKRACLLRWNRAREEERAAILEAAREHSPVELQRELAQRALTSSSVALRQQAFEIAVLGPIDEAKAQGRQDDLKRTLLPELGTYINKPDAVLAARALSKLMEVEGPERAKPFLTTLAAQEAKDEDRLHAAKLLRLAKVQSAREPFEQILKRDDSPPPSKPGLPPKRLNPKLVRAATLGLVVLGAEEPLVRRAQEYMTGASTEDLIEVLEALAQHPSEESTISLKIAMQDSRQAVRLRAIALYGERPDAEANAMIAALRQRDFAAKRQLARRLLRRFPQEWAQDLRFQLQSEERVDEALALLRDVLIQGEDVSALKPLAPVLEPLSQESAQEAEAAAQRLVSGKDPQESQPQQTARQQRPALATYLLLLLEPASPQHLTMLEGQSEVHTRYVYLEHLMRHRPAESVGVFRRYLYDDLYALRLMSAAGLWRAAQGQRGELKGEVRGEVKGEVKAPSEQAQDP